jgi:ATP/ADP translocase
MLLVNSIARPGGNITGMACISSDLALKRLQLMQQVLPGLSQLAVLFNGGVPAKVAELQDIKAAAKTLEVEVHSTDVRDASEFTTAFAAVKAGNPDGLLILADPLTVFNVKEIAKFAAEKRLPSMFGFREFCDAGGLLIAVNRIAIGNAIPEVAKHADQKLAPGNGFAMVFQDRYLTWIAILIVLLNVVNSTGEFLLGDLVTQQAHALHPGNVAAQKQFVGAFYGSFFANVNLLGLLLQVFAVSRILPKMGVRGALYILPSISLLSYSVLGLAPLLGLVRWGKTLENATDYSIQNTLRQALFLPTSREAKYKAKAAIDTFFMRFGDVLQAGIVRLGSQFQLASAGFAWLNVGLTLGWLYAVTRLAKQHREMRF